jgi:thioester reductase-like protein
MKSEVRTIPGDSAFAERILQDSRLADDLTMPALAVSAAPRVAMLTGATGYLGRYAVRELLRATEMKLVCPVRGATLEEARARLGATLESVGIEPSVWKARIEVLCGDVTQPRLGLSEDDYARLSSSVERVYHVGALVNWARGYEQLREANVLGTLEVLRFALMLRAKPVLFVSSIAVCFAHDGPDSIDEHTPMVPHAGRMPLGYAQSKCVAECLVRSVAARGLPATILRPALISGDSHSGHCNADDLIAALVEGCVATQKAIDTDWVLDCVPVDFVASVMARMPLSEAGCEVLHLVHDKPRHWKEFVLWLNLNGHLTRFVPDDEWFEVLDGPQVAATRLRGYRRFFQGLPQAGIRKPFEAYLRPRQERLDNRASTRRFEQLGLSIPPLDGELFRRYLEHYAATSLVPPTGLETSSSFDTSGAEARSLPREVRTEATRALIANAWSGAPSAGPLIQDLAVESFGSVNGILNEIAGARLGAAVGLRRATFAVAGEQPDAAARYDVVLKAKARDEVMIALISQLASLCDPGVGESFARAPEALGLPGCQERELVVYELGEPRLERFMPRCYGTHRDTGAGVWTLVLERLAAAERPLTAHGGDSWSDANIGAVVRDVAEIHAIWYRDSSRLAERACLRSSHDSAQLLRRRPLWEALRQYSSPRLLSWTGSPFQARYDELLAAPERWTKPLSAQRPTLIHNDFNPRNLVVRSAAEGPTLCAFDWELATLGPPQRDLAEFLCFVVRPEHGLADFSHWLGTHRRLLSQASGVPIDARSWAQGFAAALDHFLVERLSMYVLFDRFRPQAYLPGVARNWLRLREWADTLPGVRFDDPRSMPSALQSRASTGTLE